MNLRMLIALLLTFALALTVLGSSPQKEAEDSTMADQQSDGKLAPDEEREARELAARFLKRWQETEDIGPLIKEFFVHDFADRLHYEPELLYFGEIKDQQTVLKSSADLQRHYIAMINFLNLLVRLEEVYAPVLKSADGHKEMDLNELLPAGIWDVFKSNPTLNALMREELGDQSEGRTEGNDQGTATEADARVVKNLEELRSLTATLEQANALLRAHLKTLPSTLSISETLSDRHDDTQSSAAEDNDPLMLRPYTLSSDFYGYREGTRLICFNMMPFHIDLVREGERLKILSIHIQTD